MIATVAPLFEHQEHAVEFILKNHGIGALYMDMGCVDKDTEYLSPEGWKKISEYKGGKVAQYNPDNKMADFVLPNDYIVKPCEIFYYFKNTRGLDAMFSPEHRTLWFDHKSRPRVSPAEELFLKHQQLILGCKARFAGSFHLKTDTAIKLSDPLIRLQVAVYADGHFPYKGRCVVRLKKKNKIERMEWLLKNAFIPYKKSIIEDGFVLFNFVPPISSKHYPADWYQASYEQRMVICDEIKYWDASIQKVDSISYFSQGKADAEFIQFCFVSTGKRASINFKDRGYQDLSGVVHIVGNGRSGNFYHIGTNKNNIEKVKSADGKKYSFSVPTTFLVFRRNGCVFTSGNTGKTRAALETFLRLCKLTPELKMIVIAPLSLLESAWAEDIRKFSDFTYYNAHDNSLPEQPIGQDILLINYEAVIQKKNWYLTRHIKDNFLVIDESSRLKNHNSKTTKTILSFKDLPKYKVIMSGSPAPNSPLEYWAQMEFLRDWTLHKSFFGFRNTYFHLQRGNQITSFPRGQIVTRERMQDLLSSGWKYEITPQNLKKMMDRINPLVFWAKKEDCLTLPAQIDEVRKVEMGEKQARHYKEMKNDLITEIRSMPITAQVALAKAMKLREITSGFAIDTSGQEIDIGESPKLKELSEVIEEAGNQQQIIWACFRWDIAKICAMLKERYGECFRTLYSGTKDHQESINAFKAGDTQFLVANPHSAAHGLTFTNCSLETFFSLDYSYEYYEQAKARIHRAGQTKSCTYIHLVAKDTIDEQILKVLREKGDINQIAYQLMSQ